MQRGRLTGEYDRMLADPKYTPEKLLDAIIKSRRLKNDAELARFLDLTPPHISKIRNRKMPITGLVLIDMLDTAGYSLGGLRKLAGMKSRFAK